MMVRASKPRPPYSTGIGMDWMPNSAHRCQASRGKAASLSRRTTSSRRAPWAKAVTSWRRVSCSGVGSKLIMDLSVVGEAERFAGSDRNREDSSAT